jgi:hypothetical protein
LHKSNSRKAIKPVRTSNHPPEIQFGDCPNTKQNDASFLCDSIFIAGFFSAKTNILMTETDVN